MLKSKGDGAEGNLNIAIFGIFIIMHYKYFMMCMKFKCIFIYQS